MKRLLALAVVALGSFASASSFAKPMKVLAGSVQTALGTGAYAPMTPVVAALKAVASPLQAAAREHVAVAADPQLLANAELPKTALVMATFAEPEPSALIGGALHAEVLAAAPTYHERFGAKLATHIEEIAAAWRTPEPDAGVPVGLVPERWRDAAAVLAQAQRDGQAVAISEGGVAGETTGRVSDLRVEGDSLKFEIEGKPYEPFYGITVKLLETFTEEAAILAAVPNMNRAAAEALLKAQKDGAAVSVQESGVVGGVSGRVSDVRLEGGRLKFSIEGEPQDPFYGFTIRRLSGGPVL